ncbi:MAG: hypothetical protein KGJ59_13545 [Bacteroidota bacterium]|nr:hypothetical protein [Bacteroidota bacterium]
MISEDDKKQVKKIAQKYNVGKVYLFGSQLDAKKEPRDIDLAVEGIADSLFFKFYGELIFSLSKPVDVIDLKGKSPLSILVKREGVVLYG